MAEERLQSARLLLELGDIVARLMEISKLKPELLKVVTHAMRATEQDFHDMNAHDPETTPAVCRIAQGLADILEGK